MTSFPSGPSRRAVLRGALALGSAAALSGCAFIDTEGDAAPIASGSTASLPPAAKAKVDGDLIYFNWADYLEPTIKTGFEKEYKVKIIETNFDSYPGLLAKLNSGNQYDFITPGSKEVALLKDAGMLQRIDKEQLKNADQVFGVSPYFDDPWYDHNSDYSVPFTMYLSGIGYRKDKVTTMTDSWKDLWNEQAKGKIYVLDEADEAIGFDALKLGLSMNTTNPDDLAKIQADLIGQKPFLRGYSTDDINNLANGDAWIHHMWSGDFLTLVNNTVKDPQNYGFIAPKEGTPFGNDTYAIPKNAAHPGTALLFIDYLLRPENIDKQINWLGYPMPTKSGQDTFAALSKNFPATQISVADLSKPNVFKTQTPAGKNARDAMWTTVKAS